MSVVITTMLETLHWLTLCLRHRIDRDNVPLLLLITLGIPVLTQPRSLQPHLPTLFACVTYAPVIRIICASVLISDICHRGTVRHL